MNAIAKFVVRPSVLIIAMAVNASCSTAGLATGDADPKAGYFVNAADFYGVTFNSGMPLANQSLEESLSDSRQEIELEADLDLLNRMPVEIPARVVGFTDTQECSGQECMELSVRRAKSLHDWLIRRGISVNRLLPPHGFGDARPVGNNSTEEGRAQNRRAYISIEGD